MKYIFSVLLLLQLSGCSAIYFNTANESELEDFVKEACTENFTIYRVYTGTTFDMYGIMDEHSGQGGALLFLDIFFTFPVETVLLPYSIFQQNKYGSIATPEKCSNELNATVVMQKKEIQL